MENQKYSEIKEHLKNVLKTAKRLGLNVVVGGGYSMGYDINNLPPYPVGLFGALSIVEGPGARCKLGLPFDDTESLEAGFNGQMPRKKKGFKLNKELMDVGLELSRLVQPRLRGAYKNYSMEGMLASPQPTFAEAPPAPNWETMPAMPVFVPNNVSISGTTKKKQSLGEALMEDAAEKAVKKLKQQTLSEVSNEKKLSKKTKKQLIKTSAALGYASEKEKLLAKLAAGLEPKVAQAAPEEQHPVFGALDVDAAIADADFGVMDVKQKEIADKISEIAKMMAISSKIQDDMYGATIDGPDEVSPWKEWETYLDGDDPLKKVTINFSINPSGEQIL